MGARRFSLHVRRHKTEKEKAMSDPMRSAIIAAIIAGIFSLSSVLLTYWLNQKNAGQIARLNAAVFVPRILIDTPSKDQQSGWLLSEVSGVVKGDIPANYKILVGHRELSEQTIKIHADRFGEILSDRSFKIEDIYLGSKTQGIGKTFEIFALLVSEETIDKLNLKNDDNALGYIPDNIAKAVTTVIRK